MEFQIQPIDRLRTIAFDIILITSMDDIEKRANRLAARPCPPTKDRGLRKYRLTCLQLRNMEDTTYHLSLTRGRLLARNMVLNLLGYGAPLLVALFAIPIMIRYLGILRFGILTLAWVIIGYS